MKKTLVIVLVAVLTATLICVPVYAATYSSVTFSFPAAEKNYFGYVLNESSFENNSFQSYRKAVFVSDQSNFVNYEFELPSSYVSNGVATGRCALVLGISKFDQSSYLTSHSVWVDPFTFTYRFDKIAGIHGYRLTLRQMDLSTGVGYIVGSSDWVSFNGATYGKAEVAQTFIPIESDYIPAANADAGLALCFDFIMEAPATGAIYFRFEVLDSALTANYATQPDPNIPTYKPPANQDKVTENQELENEVLDGVAGLDLENNSSTLFDSIGTSIASFSDGLNFVRITLNLFIEDIPWIRDFVQVSLALGITATLLGLAGSIIGAASRRKGGKD